MRYLSVFACLFVAASANMFGNNGHNGNMNNMGNIFQNMMSGMGQWNTGMGQQSQNNLLQQLLHSQHQNQMGNQNWNYGGQQWQQRPQQQQTQSGMTNSLLGSLLGNMLGNMFMMNMKSQMGGWQEPKEEEKEEMSKMEELMKMSMATEMFDIMRAYNEFKDNEEEFGKAMYNLCFMVNATWAASKQYKFEVFNVTTDKTGEEMEKQSMGMTEAEKMQGAVNLLMNETKIFQEMFFRMSTWSCWAGKEYLDSATKLDKLTRGEKCDH